MADARRTKHYTQAQKQAILHAKFIDGLNGPAIRDLAAQGKLGDQPAFTISEYYVYELIRKGRDAFEDENPTALAIRTHAAVNKAHRANLAHLEALASDTDPAERARVTKAVAETAKALTATAPRRAQNTPQNTETSAAEPAYTRNTASVAQDLLRLAPKSTEQGARTGSLSDARSRPDPPRAA